MFRIYLPIVFFAIFAGWVLYKLLVTKDLKKNLSAVYIGTLFTGIWVLIYFFVIRD